MSTLAWRILSLFINQDTRTYGGQFGIGHITRQTLKEILSDDARTIQAALKELVDLGLVEEVPKLGERFRLVVKEGK